jgi:hypothetical protein
LWIPEIPGQEQAEAGQSPQMSSLQVEHWLRSSWFCDWQIEQDRAAAVGMVSSFCGSGWIHLSTTVALKAKLVNCYTAENKALMSHMNQLYSNFCVQNQRFVSAKLFSIHALFSISGPLFRTLPTA